MASPSSAAPGGTAKPHRILNINCGIVGHVDSGKTSLVRALSTELSTAALDKNPQSQERGITLDLGFSAFSAPPPERVLAAGYTALQFTLVDCPGHASLIRTIIGGAQIIDMMLLVIDVTKGIQTQTAECLVVGEITTDSLLVVLNKVDLLPPAERAQRIEAATAKIRKVLASTKFASASFVAVSATTAAAAPTVSDGRGDGRGGVQVLVSRMLEAVRVPQRDAAGPFLFAVDHCFAIKGQGTVLTGTVLAGSVSVGDTVELPLLAEQRKVKSIQMFKKPVQTLVQGDRAGICVTNLDAALVERGLLCTPGSVPTLPGALALVRKIRFFKGPCDSESKFHVTVGHSTVMATAVFFGAAELAAAPTATPPATYDWAAEYEWQAALRDPRKKTAAEPPIAASSAAAASSTPPAAPPTASPPCEWQWAALLFDNPIPCPASCLVIGSHLDSDPGANTCRLAFHGRIVAPLPSADVHELARCRLFKHKERQGVVDRVESRPEDPTDERGSFCVVIRGLFKKEMDMSGVAGLRVQTQTGLCGVIDAAFGKSGKCKATFTRQPLASGAGGKGAPVQGGGGTGSAVAPAAGGTQSLRSDNPGSSGPAPAVIKAGDAVILRYRKYLFRKPAESGPTAAAQRAPKFLQSDADMER